MSPRPRARNAYVANSAKSTMPRKFVTPSAVGKKNWLFIGLPDAGWRSAVIYSVIVSCRRRGIDPWDYVRDVLPRLPAMKHSELSSIVPARWKRANA
jgi:transposase